MHGLKTRATSVSNESSNIRNHLTLVLCTILHAFTHAYGTLLVPLQSGQVLNVGASCPVAARFAAKALARLPR